MEYRLRWLGVVLVACLVSVPLVAQKPAADLPGGGMGDLSRLSHAKSRSISPENFTGEKGKAGMAPPAPASGRPATSARGGRSRRRCASRRARRSCWGRSRAPARSTTSG